MIIPHFTQYKSPDLNKNNTGLGNALFQIFSAYGLSYKYNHTLNLCELIKLLVVLTKWGLNHKNTIYRNMAKLCVPCNNNNVVSVHERNNYYSLYDSQLIDAVSSINNNVNCYLSGYLQSFLYFDEYYKDICELISPDDASLLYIKNEYNHLFNSNVLNISCHIRLNWCKIKYDECFDYCNDAIEYIIKHNKHDYKTIIINVFSDDIASVKQNFKLKNNNQLVSFVYFEDNFDYIDLWCMSLCNHNILSNSTLSWWGAYLNQSTNKIVTYPNDILRLVGGDICNTPQLLERKYQHYKPEWVSIDTQNVISEKIRS
tara:strand:+ start:2018 stop:2962 length:945 start_codon:yes stop_codon:yes gene_type:complete